MIPRIDRYLILAFLRGAVPVLFVLVALFGFLDVTEELEDVGTGAFRTVDALLATALSLPSRAIDLFPVSALLGTLIGLGTLAGNQELNALRAAGFSLFRIAQPLCAAAAGIFVLIVLLQYAVIPRFERDVAQLHARTNFLGSGDEMEEARWLRSRGNFVRIGDVGRHGLLRNVDIFSMNAQGTLQRLLRARSARILGDGRWLLYGVRGSEPSASSTTESRYDQLYWNSGLNAEESRNLVAPVEALAPTDLYRYIRVLEDNQLNTLRYRVMFWQNVALPVQLFAMTLIGLPFIIGSSRARAMVHRVAFGAGLGVLMYFSNQLIGQAAVLYRINPFLAGVIPDLLLLGLALFAIWRTDRARHSRA